MYHDIKQSSESGCSSVWIISWEIYHLTPLIFRYKYWFLSFYSQSAATDSIAAASHAAIDGRIHRWMVSVFTFTIATSTNQNVTHSTSAFSHSTRRIFFAALLVNLPLMVSFHTHNCILSCKLWNKMHSLYDVFLIFFLTIFPGNSIEMNVQLELILLQGGWQMTNV